MKRPGLPRMPLVLVLALVPLCAAVGVQAQPATATVTVLHALPGFTADVYVNGELTLSGFEPETATDPLELPPGRYVIEIRDVGADPTSEPALAGSVKLRTGQNLSIIAGLSVAGEPELNVFKNPLSPVPPGRSRLIVRNVADVPSIDVLLDGDRVFRSVGHGDEQTSDLKAGGPFELEATTSPEVVIGPEDLQLDEGTVAIVFAVGSEDQGTLNFMFQSIRGVQSAPRNVLTGDAGLARQPGPPVWAIAVVTLAIVGFAWGTLTLMRRPGRNEPRPG